MGVVRSNVVARSVPRNRRRYAYRRRHLVFGTGGRRPGVLLLLEVSADQGGGLGCRARVFCRDLASSRSRSRSTTATSTTRTTRPARTSRLVSKPQRSPADAGADADEINGETASARITITSFRDAPAYCSGSLSLDRLLSRKLGKPLAARQISANVMAKRRTYQSGSSERHACGCPFFSDLVILKLTS